jgi:arylsulfatase A-like enzyme
MRPLPNIVLVMTDQQRADVSAREGFPLDTTPFLDGLARQGTWFDRAYTPMPVCAPARVSLFTGRYPSATRVRTNHNIEDATYAADLIDVLRDAGYATAVCGKNHSHLSPTRVDHWFPLGHSAGYGQPGRTAEEEAFDRYLQDLHHRAAMTPTPFPLACQGPYRAVSDAMRWIDRAAGGPFFLWLTFAEPHNPYQVPEPYFSLFPIEALPPTRSDETALQEKSWKYRFTWELGHLGFDDYDAQRPRARANYYGMLRLIDDQVRRLVGFLDDRGLTKDTHLIFCSDHGDFVGEYGLVRKGPEVPECLMRVPLFWVGPGVRADARPHGAHVSIADLMPTLCEAIGVPLPDGVQGRSLWPLLTGSDYPEQEFASAYGEHGFGGLHYVAGDDLVALDEDGLEPSVSFDCLNSRSQSGTLRMLRKGDWKLIVDMQGEGQLYNLAQDPAELDNLYGAPQVAAVQQALVAELLAWVLRVQDPLPLPRRRYVMKTDPRNYWSPHRGGGET